MEDTPRLVATNPDSDFILSIDEAVERYARAGHPRTPRSVQRYCAKGHLEARLIETSFGEKYLINPASLEKHIAYIDEVNPTTGRDLSRPGATAAASQNQEHAVQTGTSTEHDPSRQVASATPDMSRYVGALERETEFLRGQIGVKDTQIAALLERDKETNFLIRGLQTMLAPLLGTGERKSELNPEGKNF
jgi:hypothetical protein